MGKKILKFIARLYDHPVTKIIFYISGIALILGLLGAFSDWTVATNKILSIIVSDDALLLFLAGLLSLGFLKLVNLFDSYLEESMKLEDDHHKLITQYRKHNTGTYSHDRSFADKQGGFLVLRQLRDHMNKPSEPSRNGSKREYRSYKKNLRRWDHAIATRNPIKDDQSDEYLVCAERAEKYLAGGELYLCSINVFANIAADTTIRFDDSSAKHELPSFVITHADEILQAHKNSQRTNSSTIRLNDFDYDPDHQSLVLKTSRSTYYNMLITNRCMDYKFANGLSIREIYEYENEICPLERSKLGNQIGINGLVVTKDHYVLIEKRGRKKITWKNKFAQSISLALKLKDLGLERRDTLEDDPETAQKKIKHIIQKTLHDNFGLVSSDYAEFTIKENFLGLARDLLEGGKPNLYFYVQTNCTAAELKEKIEKNSRVIQADNIGKSKDEKRKVISTSKLDSAYYLIRFSDIEVDYQYRMFLNRKKAYRVYRRLHPRCKQRKELWDKMKHNVARTLHPVMVRECGEALLVTIAYMELRQNWASSQNKKED